MDLGFRGQGLRFRGLEFRVEDLGFRSQRISESRMWARGPLGI